MGRCGMVSPADVEEPQMNKKSQHVVANPAGGWSVRRSGASRASAVFPSEEAAVVRARELAMREGAEPYVHRADGTVRERSSYSPSKR